MADGTTEPIEEVEVGDLVFSRDPFTGKTEAKHVTATFRHHASQVLTLSLADAVTGEIVQTLTCTPGHPFYVDGKGFVFAGQLSIGTSIVTRAGPDLIVADIEWHTQPDGAPQGAEVYNFTVEDDHTYFVGTYNGGTWVHNNSLDTLAKEIHLLLPAWKRGSTTVIATAEKDGEQFLVMSNNTGSFTDPVRKFAEERGIILIEGKKAYPREHAEEMLFRIGEQNGYNFEGGTIGVSHPDGICVNCAPLVRARNMTSHSAFTPR